MQGKKISTTEKYYVNYQNRNFFSFSFPLAQEPEYASSCYKDHVFENMVLLQETNFFKQMNDKMY